MQPATPVVVELRIGSPLVGVGHPPAQPFGVHRRGPSEHREPAAHGEGIEPSRPSIQVATGQHIPLPSRYCRSTTEEPMASPPDRTNHALSAHLAESGLTPRTLARELNRLFGEGTLAETAPYYWRG